MIRVVRIVAVVWCTVACLVAAAALAVASQCDEAQEGLQ